ncbi:DNA-binding response regulator [Paenibacillus sp. CAA11]|uniref:response regulator transcription factor n=1 Tax=Paenibacillus sp. CAA11 TaxID=1532905 RepID=UPI000D3A40B2|nr:response regulator [Paenibacillus sp. CAA11]AWB46511.1 DNA-binding response regulator [Paenibacillus sp. CAA11]
MYKVLLVDDERMILDGISKVVDWSRAGCELAGTARNGLDAYEQITGCPPDIVISDIAMPGLDGIGLVARTHECYPEIRFIMLSGYKDFDYARQAMQYGVKHYLLKPCNEEQILDALTELAAEKGEQQEREQFVRRMKQDFERMLPHVKAQFLKEFITNKTYGSRDLEYYQQLFGLTLQHKPVRVLLMRVEEPYEPEHLFALQNIAADLLPAVLLSTTIQGQVLLVVSDESGGQDSAEVISSIHQVRAAFHKFYRLEVTAAVSEQDKMIRLRSLYRETLQYMSHRFYTGEGSLITKEDLVAIDLQKNGTDLDLDEDKLCLLVKSGNREEAREEVERLFGLLGQHRLDIAVTRSYVLQLYAAMIRICPEEEQAGFTSRMGELARMQTLAELETAVKEAAESLTLAYYKNNMSRQSSTVNKMLAIIEENYSNPELSLSGVAGQMLYMNADYLGKIFKKVTGESFSHYVNRYRVQQAAEHIRLSGDVKVFELADLFGFGGNAQYFSQVFKKWTGVTPSDYIKSHS